MPRSWPLLEWRLVAFLSTVLLVLILGGIAVTVGPSRFLVTVVGHGYVVLAAPLTGIVWEAFLVPWRFGLTQRGIVFRYPLRRLMVPWSLLIPTTLGRSGHPGICFVDPAYLRTNTVRITQRLVERLLNDPRAVVWERDSSAGRIWTPVGLDPVRAV